MAEVKDMSEQTVSEKNNKTVTTWLFMVVALIMLLVTFGGFVRLTRSGLSIVEWNPITGVIPPLSEEAWQTEFAKYQQTPEFQKINHTMTLFEYKEIFWLEFIHRLIARFAGLFVVIPIFYFLFKGIIPWRKSPIFLLIGLLFGFQGFMGWYMVSSGLVDNPAVDHLRLTFHLLTALLLMGLALWMALRYFYHSPKIIRAQFKSAGFIMAVFLLIVLIIQIAYGGLMAGLKAGHVSNTWPLMGGRLIPPGLLDTFDTALENLLEAPLTVHFIHRWFSLAVLLVAIVLYYVVKRKNHAYAITKLALIFIVLAIIQISLGISVIWFSVPLVLALTHQAVALLLYVASIIIVYQILHEPVTAPVPQTEKELKPTTA